MIYLNKIFIKEPFPRNYRMLIVFTGYLELSVFDGFFFHYKAADITYKFDDNELIDVKFCAENSEFTLQVGRKYFQSYKYIYSPSLICSLLIKFDVDITIKG